MDAEVYSTAIGRGATEDQAYEYATQHLLQSEQPGQPGYRRNFDGPTVNPQDLITTQTPDTLQLTEYGSRIKDRELTYGQLRHINNTDGHDLISQRLTYPDPELATNGSGEERDPHRPTRQHLHNCEFSRDDEEGSWEHEKNESQSTQIRFGRQFPSPANKDVEHNQFEESIYHNALTDTPHSQLQPISTRRSFGSEQLYGRYGGNVLETQVLVPLPAGNMENTTWPQTPSTEAETIKTLIADVHPSQKMRTWVDFSIESTALKDETGATLQKLQLPDTYAGRRKPEARKNYPFECAACQKRFLYIDSAQKHHQKHHSEPLNIIQRYNAPKRPQPGRPRNRKNARAQIRRSRTPDIGSSSAMEPIQLHRFQSQSFGSSPSATGMNPPIIHHPVLTYLADGHPIRVEAADQAKQNMVATTPTIHNTPSLQSLNTSLLASSCNLHPFQSSPPSSLIDQPTDRRGLNYQRPLPPLTPEIAPDTAQQALLGFRRAPKSPVIARIWRAAAMSSQHPCLHIASSSSLPGRVTPPTLCQTERSPLKAKRHDTQRTSLSEIDPNLGLQRRDTADENEHC